MIAGAPDSAFSPDSPYAWRRLALSLALSTLLGAGMWSVIVVLPSAQTSFGVSRSLASVPYTATMLGFAIGTLGFGRLSDRVGVVAPMVGAAGLMAAGFALSALAGNIWLFTLFHLLIGLGTGAGFGPMMADISHWFVKRRGLAVTVIASGNYLAGALWPLAMNRTMPLVGWEGTYLGIAAVTLLGGVPLALGLRRRPSESTLRSAESVARANRADLGLSPRALQILLVVAGFSCCAAMAMPQVHLVAYCGDLGYGAARGAEMLSLMLGLGVVSRIASGFVADRIGGAATLLIGSMMQGVALVLYLFFDSLASLYIISGLFGLFQGGIVPMYAVICREFLPPREAGERIGAAVAATIVGMAFGGYAAGLIFDLTASYALAFLHGVAWNAVNLAVVAWLFLKRPGPQPVPA